MPEVNAIRATSSLAVATGSKEPGSAVASSRVSSARIGPPALRTSSASRASTSPCETCAREITFESSPARSIGIVATTIPPASRIPNQHATAAGR